jgi:hypothetical protein
MFRHRRLKASCLFRLGHVGFAVIVGAGNVECVLSNDCGQHVFDILLGILTPSDSLSLSKCELRQEGYSCFLFLGLGILLFLGLVAAERYPIYKLIWGVVFTACAFC